MNRSHASRDCCSVTTSLHFHQPTPSCRGWNPIRGQKTSPQRDKWPLAGDPIRGLSMLALDGIGPSLRPSIERSSTSLTSESGMSDLFRRQMMDYVEYHRDPRNGLMHVVGIIFLYLGAVLPLSLWQFDALGLKISLGAILTLPVLAYWLLLDAALGAGILAFAVLFLATAMMIVDHVHGAALWALFITLIVFGFAAQAVGHQVFERNKPSLLDHPAHLWLGPMFVMAKLYMALGFRPAVADIIASSRLPHQRRSEQLQGDQHSHP
jgi:uncharacterized membrane protein YGL010W